MVDFSKKATYVEEFQEKLKKSQVIIVAGCEGVNVEQMTALRKDVRNSGAEIRIVKNTLLQRAAKNLGKEKLCEQLVGCTSITFGYTDPAAPVKVLFDFAGKAAKFKFKGGMLGEKMLSVSDLQALSRLPGKKQLLAMLASVFQGPLRNLVSVCQGPIRKMVYALDAIRQKKSKEAEASVPAA